MITLHDLAKMIDHSLLHPTLTDADLKEGCALAVEYDVATVCIKPYAVPDAAEWLAGSDVAVCAVAGFPHGNSHTALIVEEALRACREGATEIDIVSNTGKVLGGAWGYVRDEIRAENDAVTGAGAILKVIFENDVLQDEHVVRLCEICTECGVAFAKTSTGYGMVKQQNGTYAYQGATEHHLKLMRAHCGPKVQIKAAGGVRTVPDMVRARARGATRIGASATSALLDDARQRIERGEDLQALQEGRLGGGGY